ncbi:unnamed protein product [Lactuca virosa]|uniref:Resistance protein candidate n=1 Tax=Lactuca virosa TaxID=75947 RepID=A0AAU9NDE0_9ASTR|nr:unnamed protein product [Lactuca virosa]
MDVINAIIKPVVDTLMVPVKRHLGYVINCTKYVRDMHNKLSELNSAKIGVEDHIKQNTSSLLEVPAQVRGWLEDVGKINAKIEDMPSDVSTCFSLKLRHRVGRKAFKIIEEVESVTRKHSLIIWTDHPIPLGKVDSMKASVSMPSTDHDDFKSREQIFTEALQALHPNHKSHMIALCGMGGVGKTTMMQRLKKIVQEKKMFDFIIEAVIGHKTDPIAIQEAVADYLSIELKEKTKSARADKLRKMLVAKSDGGKNKFLVILDDVWQFVDLEDIGLSPLPNQGVDFKVLLTSRDVDVCTMMGVEANSILNMKILLDEEAQSLFMEFVQISSDVDPNLHKMGEDIVRKCCGLPIAIKTMALTLRNKSKDAWSDALSRLEHHDFHNFVNEVFGISYDYLQDQETKSIFLLCGLFPEDYNIPPEELVRYGWGLNLFKKVYTIREARARLNTCIERLIHTNLLMEGDVVGCVKMHDLALAFVMDMFSKVQDASIVNHGSMSGWPENDVSGSCQRISLTCKGMSRFPKDLNFPNLTILKLMHGDKFLKFPPDFYEQMEKLQVVSFHEMKYPFLPSSPQYCSTNLRVLHLHQCSLMFDCSCIGNLFNLEVLSFANSGIEWLPSRIGNLKKLRLLDLTDCFGLRIDKGVLKNLVKLEEVYMRVAVRNKKAGNRKAISFTDDNCNEMAELSKNLFALEFEFFEINAQPKNMSFEKLERFKISMGSELRADHLISSRHSFENTLRLVTKKGELLESRMNELFQKTEVLYLSVRDMNHLEDVEVKSMHPPQSSSFYNLRVLVVSRCAELRYLFTLSVVKALSKLEHLRVSTCRNMEELIHTGGNGEEKIMFPKLKFLDLHTLWKLSGLCHNVNVIELPQLLELELFYIPNITSIYHKNNSETSCLLNKEVMIPKLEKLSVRGMDNLKEIWPCEYRMSGEVKLREIKVDYCNNLVNLFPCNPMPLMHYLEELEVKNCGSIEMLFNIDLDCVGGVGEDCGSSNLRSIDVFQLRNLSEIWRVKGENNSHLLVRGFQAVESITIGSCVRFRHVFMPTTTNFDLGALIKVSISCCGENRRKNESMESDKKTNILSKEETSQVGDSISKIFRFSSCLANSFHNLRMLELRRYEGVEVVFEIESPTSRELVTTHHNQQQPILPNLQELDLREMYNMSHVWKCRNWNKFFTLPKQQSESPFHNLTTINIMYCKSIKYLFSPLMGKLLSNLKTIYVAMCDGIEEVVSNRDDEDQEYTTSVFTNTSTTMFPCLNSLSLNRLDSLKCIGGSICANGGNNEISSNNSTTTTAFVDQFKSSQVGDVSWALCQYSREITIRMCYKLSSLIPSYAAGQMQKLEKLKIEHCGGMKELFETQGINNNNIGCEEGNFDTSAIPRPNNGCMLQLVNLKELNIDTVNHLEYVFPYSALESLGKLEGLWIRYCSAMKVIVKKEEDDGEQQTIRTKGASSNEVVVFAPIKSIILSNLPCLMGFFLGMNEFTHGWSTAPQIKYIDTSLGKHSLEYGLINIQFPNLKILNISDCDHLEHIFTLSAVASLKQLEELRVWNCKAMKVIVKKEEEDASSSSSSKKVVVFPRLKSITLGNLQNLMGFFLGMNDFQLPLLDDLVIKRCPQMVVFTSGQLTALKLKHVQTGVGTYILEYGLNFHVSTTVHHQNLFQSSNITSSSPATTNGVVPWSYQNLIKLHVSSYMETPKKLFPCNELQQLQNLEMIRVWRCNLVEEVFEALQGTNSGSTAASQTTLVKLPNLRQVELEGLMNLRYIWRSNQWTVFELANLTRVEIKECSRLEYVFTIPMVGSLLQLQDLTVRSCKRMEEVISKDANVVVEEEQEESNGKRNEIVLPCLRSITLGLLPCLKGFSLGKEDFSFPLLDTLRFIKCPTITIFTNGNSATPQLKEIETIYHSFHAEEDINSFIKIRQQFIQHPL